MAKTVDPKMYAFAADLAADLPAVLSPVRHVWIDLLAYSIQHVYDEWVEDAASVAVTIASREALK